MDLVQWLRDQLDEDERIARATDQTLGQRNLQWSVKPMDEAFCKVVAAGYYVVGTGEFNPEDALHIAAHDPARVLREIDATRGIVARYEFACREAGRLDLTEEEREVWVRVGGALQSVVIQLAAPYDDRPGYLKEWAL